MKLIWNNSLKKQDFAGNRENFVFQAQPEEQFRPAWTRSASSNMEIYSEANGVSDAAMKIVGTDSATETSKHDFGNIETLSVEGILPSEHTRRLFNIPRQIWLGFFSERILTNRVNSSADDLNIAYGGSMNRYADIRNELIQNSLDDTLQLIVAGGSQNNVHMANASLFAMDYGDKIATEADKLTQNRIKTGNSQQKKTLRSGTWFKRASRRILPTNWFGNRGPQAERMNRRNIARNRDTNTNFRSKAVTARENLLGVANQVDKHIQNHIDRGSSNRNENQYAIEFNRFVRAVVADPQGFLGGNGNVFANFNFQEVCHTDLRPRILDAILLYRADEAVEGAQTRLDDLDMTGSIENITDRNNTSETAIEVLDIDNVLNTIPARIARDPNYPTERLSDDDLFKMIVQDLGITILQVIPRNMEDGREKLPFILNLLAANQNNIAGNLSQKTSDNIRFWTEQFNIPGDENGLEQNEWQEIIDSSNGLLAAGEIALNTCDGLAANFIIGRQQNLPAQMGQIMAFVNLFDINKTTIEQATNDNGGQIFKRLLDQMSPIRDRLKELVDNINQAIQTENTRINTPIQQNQNYNGQALFPNAQNLNLTIPYTWAALQGLFNGHNARINGGNINGNVVQAFQIPAQQAQVNINIKAQSYLREQARESRENSYMAKLKEISKSQWYYWSNRATRGNEIPMIQVAPADLIDDPTMGAINAHPPFQDLHVVANNGDDGIILDNQAGDIRFMVKPHKNDPDKIMMYEFIVPAQNNQGINQHGVDAIKELPSEDNADRIFQVLTMPSAA